MNINEDLFEYFMGDTNGHPMLGELERVRVRIFIAAILEQRCAYPDNIPIDREALPAFYKRMAKIYEIPFPPYLLTLLYKVEEGANLYERYRDHMLHLFYVFCLGCYIFDNSSFYRAIEVDDVHNFMANWIVAAFLHDVGYIFSEDEFGRKHETGAEFQRIVRCGTGDIKQSFNLFWSWVLTVTQNEQPEFAVPDSTANAILRVNRRDLELAVPYFWSTEEKCCKFDQYNSKDLFEELPRMNDMQYYTNNVINVYDFYSREGRYNHGLVSSLVLLFIVEARKTLISNGKLPEEITDLARQKDAHCSICRFRDGIWAISLHDLRTDYTRVSVLATQTPPLISLLLLADGLQCWDRQYFRQESSHLRAPLPASAVGLRCSEGDIFWDYEKSYSDEPEYINASYDRIVLGECTAFLSRNDVERIIKRSLEQETNG